jgi:hypothetical protein
MKANVRAGLRCRRRCHVAGGIISAVGATLARWRRGRYCHRRPGSRSRLQDRRRRWLVPGNRRQYQPARISAVPGGARYLRERPAALDRGKLGAVRPGRCAAITPYSMRPCGQPSRAPFVPWKASRKQSKGRRPRPRLIQINVRSAEGDILKSRQTPWRAPGWRVGPAF